MAARTASSSTHDGFPEEISQVELKRVIGDEASFGGKEKDKETNNQTEFVIGLPICKFYL